MVDISGAGDSENVMISLYQYNGAEPNQNTGKWSFLSYELMIDHSKLENSKMQQFRTKRYNKTN